MHGIVRVAIMFAIKLGNRATGKASLRMECLGACAGGGKGWLGAYQHMLIQVLILLALLVQNYLLYWYKSTNSEP
jgi:hypothetical protein